MGSVCSKGEQITVLSASKLNASAYSLNRQEDFELEGLPGESRRDSCYSPRSHDSGCISRESSGVSDRNINPKYSASPRPEEKEPTAPQPNNDYNVFEIDLFENTTDRKEQGRRMSVRNVVHTRDSGHQIKYPVLDQTKILPRYIYHLSLLEWFRKRIPSIPEIQELGFKECHILLGGNVDKGAKRFGESAFSKEIAVNDLSKGADGNDIMMVYLLTREKRNMEEILKFGSQMASKHITILFLVNRDYLDDDRWRQTRTDELKKSGITEVDFVQDLSYEVIINKITCILEKRISVYLERVKHKLIQLSHTQNVGSSLLEVEAILTRLREAACYPHLGTGDDDEKNEEETEKDVDEIIDRFGDKILYHGYDGNKHYVITTDEGVKESLASAFSNLRERQAEFKITVKENVAVSELTRTGTPLHGAKFVYVNNGVDAFMADRSFATTGSLLMANGNSMVVVTCRHALERDPIYVLIDESVEMLGRQVHQSQNNMERIEDDVALVEIEDTTRPLLDDKCEKLLIDALGNPTPARKSSRILKKGDIVYKRGATTGLTTGIVSDVRATRTGRFRIATTVIFINGEGNSNFAGPGDSGSLVFQHSLSPVENILDVVAIVQGKMQEEPNNTVCFSFQKGCDTLHSNISTLHSLKFVKK